MTRDKTSKTVLPTSKQGRTYFPAKTFDDDLVALVDLYSKSGWSFSGVDLKQLAEDSRRQREERLAHDAAEAAWLKIHKEFGVQTEARHQRFSAALNAARGAFKNDKGVTAQLQRFRRSGGRRSSSVVEISVVGTATG